MMGSFYLLRTAPTPRHLDATKDDHKDWPCDTDETGSQNAEGSQEEIQADENQKPRERFMMRALADHALPHHFFFFHNED